MLQLLFLKLVSNLGTQLSQRHVLLVPNYAVNDLVVVRCFVITAKDHGMPVKHVMRRVKNVEKYIEEQCHNFRLHKKAL